MRCSRCGSENRDAAKFCDECAAPLSPTCPACGASNRSAAKFCDECGAPLVKPPAALTIDTAPVEARRAVDAERRRLSVLFSDLVNSTIIAANLDPEEWREMVADYQRAVSDAIVRFGGRVAKYLGDGVMAYFGYPQAHENDTERAVRAGLAIIERVAALNRNFEQIARPKLSVRVGIHTGAVVVGAGAGSDADVFGDTPNLAARVQTAAEPDTVLITADTQRLAAGSFVVENRGKHRLKGVAEPTELYRVIRPSGVRGRVDSASRGLAPFVGREDELRLLLNRWELACEGEGQTVLVIGEAGIGKSRLIREFHQRIAGTPHTLIECAGDPLFDNSPFHAVTQMLNQGLALRGDETAEERFAQLERTLEMVGLKLAEAAPLIAEMLDLPMPRNYPPLLLAPEQKRRRLLATLAGWSFGSARTQPLAIVVEDLHWVDPSTLELLQILVEQGATAPLLLLCTARPEFRAPWPMRAHHAQLTLNRLSRVQVHKMVAEVAARSALSAEVVNALVERTAGVPLFVEELTQTVLEKGGGHAVREIPATLHDSLMARLDRLGAAREVAQVAAVIGREFSYQLLAEVAATPEPDVQSALAKLADAELIYSQGMPPEATYTFKHALIQDTAYEALLKSRRREIHGRVARALADKLPGLAEARPELLAQHWTEAGEAEPALAAWTKAGAAARQRHAFKEAEGAFWQALAVLNALTESPERDAREMVLLSELNLVLMVTKGYSARETTEIFERLRELARKSGNLVLFSQATFSAWAAAATSADYASAGALADQMLDVTRSDDNPTNLAFAYVAQGGTCFMRGDLARADESFTRARELLADPGFRYFPGAPGYALARAGLTAWLMGRAKTAAERIRAGLAVSREINSPYDEAFALYLEAQLQVFLREPEKVETSAARALALCEQHHGFAYIAAQSRISTGWARAQLGRRAEGTGLIREGLAAMTEGATRASMVLYLTELAEAQALDGAVAPALDTVERALQLNPDELVYRPEALRVRGDLRLRQENHELAELDYREALALAQKIGAKAWELRATTSLARLLDGQGKRDEARATLSEIYSWFTEGLETADLKDAKALLEELRR